MAIPSSVRHPCHGLKPRTAQHTSKVQEMNEQGDALDFFAHSKQQLTEPIPSCTHSPPARPGQLWLLRVKDPDSAPRGSQSVGAILGIIL